LNQNHALKKKREIRPTMAPSGEWYFFTTFLVRYMLGWDRQITDYASMSRNFEKVVVPTETPPLKKSKKRAFGSTMKIASKNLD
jgi:hypothetical protein